jgi:hypothetical protein
MDGFLLRSWWAFLLGAEIELFGERLLPLPGAYADSASPILPSRLSTEGFCTNPLGSFPSV